MGRARPSVDRARGPDTPLWQACAVLRTLSALNEVNIDLMAQRLSNHWWRWFSPSAM